ncbi:MAG: dTDP-4-dehydrorhamnose reductase [Hespellia sp.]|nr:dTDP-4-dehydrorhamnose reductase [Hespellia sp.]
MLKLWICGANGQIGQAINEVLDPLEFEVFNSDKEELDITDIDEVISFGEINRPDVIINCAGVTHIDVCEEDPKLAYKVNALGARNLAIISAKLNAKIVQLSSDDVFDGRSLDPYNEFDKTNPMTTYGRSKLAGENYVKEFTQKHFILRSTWVYGKGSNFVSHFLERVESGDRISVAADQFGSPTSANELARFILYIIKTNEYGTYHATCTGTCSRYAFAKEILALTGKSAELKAVPTKESEFSVARPAYAVLDNFIMSIIDVYDFPDWKSALKDFIQGGN